MESDGGPLPDHLRCGRTDGKQWRCSRRAMGDRLFCRAHHLQARYRQYKKKVPESLKIQRKPPNRKSKPQNREEDSLGHHVRLERVLAMISNGIKSGRSIELIERVFGDREALVVGKKRKLGELLLELARVFLEREIEKRRAKEEEVRLEEVMLDLPNGVMSISLAPPVPVPSLGNAGSVCDWKLGLCSDSLMRKRIRSKNVEPIQFGSCKVYPCGRNVAGLNKVGEENCIKDQSRYPDMSVPGMIQIGELSDHLRCTYSDGQQWRCSQRAMDGRKFCKAHILQACLRQNKQKVPEFLKFK